jgi:hypothetical protein
MRSHLLSILLGLLLFTGVGCIPMRGTMPAHTFRPGEREPAFAQESDSGVARWSPAGLASLRWHLARGEPAVVSYLGSRVDVLGNCAAPGAYRRIEGRHELDREPVYAQALTGDCVQATHVVRGAPIDLMGVRDEHDPRSLRVAVDLAPISLGAFDLTGVWRGVMRQPHGPYEVYDALLRLEHHGERVTGTTHLRTIDGAYWGELHFEGRLEGNVLYFADALVIDDNLGIFLAWCMKGGYLLVDPRRDRLDGPWKACMCTPGTLHFERDGLPSSEPPHALSVRLP